MSNVKERIIGAVTVMSETDARKVWFMIQNEIAPVDFNHWEEVEPDEYERATFRELANGNPDYQPTISHEQLKAELGL